MRKKILLLLIIFLLVKGVVGMNETIEYSSKTVCSDVSCNTILYSYPIAYYDGTELVEIDTTITNTNKALYDYESVGMFNSYFKIDPSTADSVRFEYNSSKVNGKTPYHTGFVTYQPHSLNYRNDYDMTQQISTTQSVTGVPTDNVFMYLDIFGSGLSISYTVYNDVLKQKTIIDAFSDLPTPEQYIIDGGNVTLDMDFLINWNDDEIDIYVDGEVWDKKTTIITDGQIDFKKDGDLLWNLPKPYVEDNNYDIEYGWYQLKKGGSKLYINMKVPYSFLETAEYPVVIDPTLILQTADVDNLGDRILKTVPVGDENLGGIIKFNITRFVGSNYTFESAKLHTYIYFKYGSPTLNIFHITNQTWKESAVSSSFDGMSVFNKTTTNNISSTGWNTFNVTTQLNEDIGTNYNFTILLEVPEYNITNNTNILNSSGGYLSSLSYIRVGSEDNNENHIRFYSKEYSNSTLRLYLNISYTESNAPTFTAPINNGSGSKINQLVLFQANITDDIDLDYYVFAHNMSGTMTNGTDFDISGLSYLAVGNVTANITRTEICGLFYFNDTSGNMNQTSQSCYNVTNSVPVVDSVNITPTTPTSGDNLTFTNSTSDADSDTVTNYSIIWYFNGVQNSTFNNLTTITSGNITDGDNITVSLAGYDTYGWSSYTNSSTITVGDVTVPVITNCSASSGSVTQNTIVKFCCNVTDNNYIALNYPKFQILNPAGGRTNYTYDSLSGNTYCRNLSMGSIGTHTWEYLFARDGSGNDASEFTDMNVLVSAATGEVSGGGGDTGAYVPVFGLFVKDPTTKKIYMIGSPGTTSKQQFRIYNNVSYTQEVKFELDDNLVNRCELTLKEYSLPGSSEVVNYISCVHDVDRYEGKINIYYGVSESESIMVTVSNYGQIIQDLIDGEGAWAGLLFLSFFIIPISIFGLIKLLKR